MRSPALSAPTSEQLTAPLLHSHSRPPTNTVSVIGFVVETSNKVRKSEQTTHDLTNKLTMMELVTTNLLPLTYLTITSKAPVREHLAGVCRASNSFSSEI